jgi:hypothetical protein
MRHQHCEHLLYMLWWRHDSVPDKVNIIHVHWVGYPFYLEAKAHRYVTGCKVDEKARHEEWGYLSMALQSISSRYFGGSHIAYALVKGHRGVVCIVEAADTRPYINTLFACQHRPDDALTSDLL